MATESKDTIYIDVDEEITGIISKVQSSPKDIVALVLPKRAAVLQSVVNMKLLKRAEDQSNKKVVLITSESRIMPLAGAAGLFVASNLTSKPYVPLAKVVADAKADSEAGDEVDPNTPISQVAPDAKFADSDGDIEIDNTPKVPAAGAETASGSKPKKNKKTKVPNFAKFRKKAIIIALILFLLIGGLVYAFTVAPKATVTVKAQTSQLPINFDFTADPKINSPDTDNKVVRANTQTTQKSDTEKVDASGTANKGKKASGSVTMTAKKCGGNPFTAPSSVPAGTGVSANGITYLTQEGTSFTTNGAQPDSQPNCYDYPAVNNTSITAQSAGKDANTNNTGFSVNGRSDVTAQGSASGGTDKNVKVVTQDDVNKAEERIKGAPNTTHDDFAAQLKKDGYVPIEDSYKAKQGNYDISPNVGGEGDQVTVSATTTYTMTGVKEDDLKQLIEKEVKDQSQGKDQNILSYGIDNAKFKVNKTSGLQDGQMSLSIDAKVVVGPNLNQDDIKNKISGKKPGEVRDILGQIPGLNDPQVNLSPFWVSKVPANHSKIIIDVQQADGSQIP